MRYSIPAAGEEDFEFTVVEDLGDRIRIRLICDLPIPPVETVSPDDIIPAARKLRYKDTGRPVKVGDKVPGKRMGKFYAHVMAVRPDHVELLYNGDVNEVRAPFDAIDAAVS